MEIFHGQEADHGKNESNKSDFNEALEHNLEGKTSEKDRVSPEKLTNKVLFPSLPPLLLSISGSFALFYKTISNGKIKWELISCLKLQSKCFVDFFKSVTRCNCWNVAKKITVDC